MTRNGAAQHGAHQQLCVGCVAAVDGEDALLSSPDARLGFQLLDLALLSCLGRLHSLGKRQLFALHMIQLFMLNAACGVVGMSGKHSGAERMGQSPKHKP